MPFSCINNKDQIKSSMNNKYYTYAYLREDRTPYYIGKGNGNRLYKKGKCEIKPPKDKTRVIFLKQNLTEEEAFKHEKYMIAVFGRKDLGTGILRNKTSGGEGVSHMSEDTKKKISLARRGIIFSEEHRKNIGKAFKDKKLSDERRMQISKTTKNNWSKPEYREKIISSMKNKNIRPPVRFFRWEIVFEDGRILEIVDISNWSKKIIITLLLST